MSCEQEEKQVVETETQEIVGQKRRARTCSGTSSTSSASKEMVAAGGTRRRSKRVKVAVKVTPAYYVPAGEESALEAWSYASRSKRVKVAVKVAPAYYVPAEEESLEAWSYASSGVVIKNTALASSPLDESSATADSEITPMNGSNEDADTDSSRMVSAVAAATRVHKGREVQKTFDDRFKDLMSFKAEFGHCNVPQTRSRNKKQQLSLSQWCSKMRMSYKAIQNGSNPLRKLSKADIKRLENVGFEWKMQFPFDKHFNDLMAFKAEFGHCKVQEAHRSRISRKLQPHLKRIRFLYESTNSV